MLSTSINSCLSHFKGVFNVFGIDFTTHFAKGLSYETLHSAAKNKKAFSEVLDSSSILQNGSFLSLVYNYGPLQRSDSKPHNQNAFATLPNRPLQDLPHFPDLSSYSPSDSEKRYLPKYFVYYDGKTDRDVSDFYSSGFDYIDTRLVLPFSIDLELIFLTGDTDLINVLQFLLLAHFGDKVVEFDIPMTVNDHDYPIPHYYIVDTNIKDVGFISYESMGTLQKLEFNLSLSGILLSPFVSETNLLEHITLSLGIKNPSVSDLRSKF